MEAKPGLLRTGTTAYALLTSLGRKNINRYMCLRDVHAGLARSPRVLCSPRARRSNRPLKSWTDTQTDTYIRPLCSMELLRFTGSGCLCSDYMCRGMCVCSDCVWTTTTLPASVQNSPVCDRQTNRQTPMELPVHLSN